MTGSWEVRCKQIESFVPCDSWEEAIEYAQYLIQKFGPRLRKLDVFIANGGKIYWVNDVWIAPIPVKSRKLPEPEPKKEGFFELYKAKCSCGFQTNNLQEILDHIKEGCCGYSNSCEKRYIGPSEHIQR